MIIRGHLFSGYIWHVLWIQNACFCLFILCIIDCSFANAAQRKKGVSNCQKRNELNMPSLRSTQQPNGLFSNNGGQISAESRWNLKHFALCFFKGCVTDISRFFALNKISRIHISHSKVAVKLNMLKYALLVCCMLK